MTPLAWIITAGFTGRCHGDEECHALAHATKRCMMGRGSYDNNDKLGLTGGDDDGLWLEDDLLLAHTSPPVWLQTGVWPSGDRLPKLCRQYGVCQIHS